MTCCTACVHGGECVTFRDREGQARAHLDLIRRDAESDEVRALARRIVRGALGPEYQGSSEREAEAVHAYLASTLRYVQEPGDVWTRTMDLVRMGAGDCDDMAGAAAALLRALGHAVGLAYTAGHVWAVAVSPDGDVWHVDPTRREGPRWGAPAEADEVFVLEAGVSTPFLTGAKTETCEWSDVTDVPRDKLVGCLSVAAEAVKQGGAWPDWATEAAVEIWRRIVEGHGSAGPYTDGPTSWVVLFLNKHGCRPLYDLAPIVQPVVDVSDVLSALEGVGLCSPPDDYGSKDPAAAALEALEDEAAAIAASLGIVQGDDGAWRTPEGDVAYFHVSSMQWVVQGDGSLVVYQPGVSEDGTGVAMGQALGRLPHTWREGDGAAEVLGVPVTPVTTAVAAAAGAGVLGALLWLVVRRL